MLQLSRRRWVVPFSNRKQGKALLAILVGLPLLLLLVRGQAARATLVGVVLPADARPGETVSGTVTANPEQYQHLPGLQVVTAKLETVTTADARTALEGMTVTLPDGSAQAAAKPFTLQIPADGKPLEMTLSAPDKKATATCRLPRFDAPTNQVIGRVARAADFNTSPVWLAGTAQLIRGPFDGNAASTSVLIDGVKAQLLTESPRGAMVVPPALKPGPCRMEVREGETARSFQLVIVGIEMSAERLHLLRGESTRFSVRVTGADQIPADTWRSGVVPELTDGASLKRFDPGFRLPDAGRGGLIFLGIENVSTDVVRMVDTPGQAFARWLGPGEFRSGPYQFQGTLRSVKTGSFVINGVVVPFLAPVEGKRLDVVENDNKVTQPEEPPVIQVDDNSEEHHPHHCQGGRLMVIIGNENDKTIDATLNLVASLPTSPNTVRVFFHSRGDSDPDMINPSVPDPAGSARWVRATRAVPGKPGTNALASGSDLVSGFCYFEEVMVLFHGSQVGGYRSMRDRFPRMIGNRPIRKLIFWSCRSAEILFPNSTQGRGRPYETLAWIYGPRPCPCQCDKNVCRAQGPDGQRSACPDASDPVTIYAAGAGVDAKGERRVTKLGLRPDWPRTPFTSPDGKLRKITVNPDGSIGAEIIPGPANLFGGLGVAADPEAGLVQPDFEKFNDSVQLAPSQVLDPRAIQDKKWADKSRAKWADPANRRWVDPENGKTPAYPGSKCCSKGEGCQPDAM